MTNTYGSHLNSQEIVRFLEYTLNQNDRLAEKGGRGTPICVWGPHGIGKTETIINYASSKGYSTVYCAPAQFEEMGDLHGIPEVFDPTPELPNNGDEYTIYRQPEWLRAALDSINTDKPGIFILDDFNRADTRILQGCMQLLQLYGLFSWSLPPRWQIVLTANPEGGAYQVTEMDDAMLTRMLHVTMRFDAKCWAEWALNSNLDSRGIEFILTYPEVMNGVRTTARSFTQFLRQVGSLSDYTSEDNMWITRVIGEGTMEKETVDRFLHFMSHEQNKLIQPEEILETQKIASVIKKINQIVKGKGAKRNDLLATICTRLQLFVTSPHYKFKNLHKTNLVEFLVNEEMEAALRFGLHQAISVAPLPQRKECSQLIRDPRLAKEILTSM